MRKIWSSANIEVFGGVAEDGFLWALKISLGRW